MSQPPDRPRSWFAPFALLGPELEPARDVHLTIGPDGTIRELREDTTRAGASLLDGVLIPGLIDSHVHLAMDGGSDVVASLRAPRSVLAARVLSNARAQLEAGVTTVRDLGSPGDLVAEMAPAFVDHPTPRVIAAGVVAASGGHGSFLGRTADGPDQVRAAVREVGSTGASWLKIFTSGGVVTAGSATSVEQWFADEIDAAVRTAASLGLRVAAHAHSRPGIDAALAAGVDSVEHCSEIDAELVATLAASATAPVSTLIATERFVRSRDIETSRPDVVAKIRAHAPREREGLRRLLEGHPAVVAGTDAGTTHNPHGRGLAEQAQLLVDAGAEPTTALQTMTVRAAELLGVAAGSVDVGRVADLVVLEADPLADLAALLHPSEVLRGGVHVPG